MQEAFTTLFHLPIVGLAILVECFNRDAQKSFPNIGDGCVEQSHFRCKPVFKFCFSFNANKLHTDVLQCKACKKPCEYQIMNVKSLENKVIIPN